MSRTAHRIDLDSGTFDPADGQAKYRYFQQRAQDTNINATTLLTTDYLNHFSGFLMLLEMLPSAPDDMAGELVSWEPLSYEEHFASSGFRDKELAIAAYAHAPKEFKVPFDQTIHDLNEATEDLRDLVRNAVEQGDTSLLFPIADGGAPMLRSLIEHAGSIVNGLVIERTDPSQSTVDALFD